MTLKEETGFCNSFFIAQVRTEAMLRYAAHTSKIMVWHIHPKKLDQKLVLAAGVDAIQQKANV